MSKVTNMAIFIFVACMLMHFGGLITYTPMGMTVNLLSDLGNIKNSNFYQLIVGAFGLVTLTGAAISFFAPQAVGLIVKRTFVLSGLVVIGWDLLAIYSLLNDINSAFAVLICLPLLMTYLIASMEWWK